MIIRDRSGKPSTLNTALLQLLLKERYVPVITVPIADEQGVAISADNDDIVGLLSRELGAQQIIQLIEAPGLLEDAGDETSLVSALDTSDLERWEDRVEGRMKRKMHAIVKLFDGAARPTVYIGDGRVKQPVLNLLNGGGTIIYPMGRSRGPSLFPMAVTPTHSRCR